MSRDVSGEQIVMDASVLINPRTQPFQIVGNLMK
jgi:hypothetical protein